MRRANPLGRRGYSLQANRKTREGKQHPDRDAQFRHLNATVKRFQRRGQPVMSVDTKKKELIGHTTTAIGREVRAELDRNRYPAGEKVLKPKLAQLRLTTVPFHGDWNYPIATKRGL